jgi:uncharacterized YccA/Bax inhibitor family protein
MFEKSGNPVLGEKAFRGLTLSGDSTERMTLKRTMNKTGLLMLLVLAGAYYTWDMFSKGQDTKIFMFGGMIGGFILALVTVFKKEWAPYTAPAYALMQGLFLGAISALYNYAFAEKMPNIITNAVGLTICVGIAMFLLYHFRIIKVTEKFRSIIVMATVGIALFYLIVIVARFFGANVAFMHDSSPLGIGLSLFIIGIAALNLLLDFDMIEQGSNAGAPKYMEWFGGFALLVTLVWLYLEILRLLSRFASSK